MNLKTCQGFLLMALVVWGIAGGPAPGTADAAGRGFAEITAPEVKNMLDEKRAVVVNVLSAIEYEMQHITGSINIPINKFETSNLLPADKNTPLVLYCMGVT